MRSSALLLVVGLVACGGATSPTAVPPSSGTTNAPIGECRLDGEYVGGVVRAGEGDEQVSVSIGNVRASVVVDRDGVLVVAEQPLRFEGRAEGVTVHATSAIDHAGAVRVDPLTQLGVRRLTENGSLRVGIPSVPELDLSIGCEGLVGGAPARDPRLVGVADLRTRIAADGEVPLFVSAERTGDPVAWLGGAGRRAIVVGTLEPIDRRTARLRILAEGIVVVAFADANLVEALEPEPEVWPTPARSRAAEPIPGTMVSLPSGTPVFSAATGQVPWGTTTVSMQVRTDAHDHGRIRILEFGADVDPGTTPAPGPSRSRRIVRATPAVDPGVIWVGDAASWVGAP